MQLVTPTLHGIAGVLDARLTKNIPLAVDEMRELAAVLRALALATMPLELIAIGVTAP